MVGNYRTQMYSRAALKTQLHPGWTEAQKKTPEHGNWTINQKNCFCVIQTNLINKQEQTEEKSGFNDEKKSNFSSYV